MASARVPGNFSRHSFRIRATTVAARNEVPDHLIQSMGRWSSNAYQLYIRTPAEALAALSIKLARWEFLQCLLNLAPSCMRIMIKGSKNDPFRKGCFIHIGVGRRPLCAVRAVMNYLALRGDAPGPLLPNGQPLSPNILTDWLRQIMASARVPGNFSSHSFHIRAATVAARNGVPEGPLVQQCLSALHKDAG